MAAGTGVKGMAAGTGVKGMAAGTGVKGMAAGTGPVCGRCGGRAATWTGAVVRVSARAACSPEWTITASTRRSSARISGSSAPRLSCGSTLWHKAITVQPPERAALARVM
jgi:hypothetical protein